MEQIVKELGGCMLAAFFAGIFIVFAYSSIDVDNVDGFIQLIHRFIRTIGG